MGHCTLPTPPAAAATAVAVGNAPPPPAPRVNAADAIWGADAMQGPRAQMYREHGGGRFSQVMVDLAEYQARDGRDGWRWDGEFWWGGDRDRLVVKAEGHADVGRRVEEAEVEALYSRAIGPYFNLQAGVRHDIAPNPSRTYLAIGVEGLAPYWLDVEGTLYLSDRGDLSARGEAYYDQRITQRLILQPRAELNLALSDDRARQVGRGLSEVELGLRLRHEIAREFAPYVGVNWQRRFGRSARFARAGGDDVSSTSLVFGVRAWF